MRFRKQIPFLKMYSGLRPFCSCLKQMAANLSTTTVSNQLYISIEASVFVLFQRLHMSTRLTDNSTVCSKLFQVNIIGIVNPPN